MFQAPYVSLSRPRVSPAIGIFLVNTRNCTGLGMSCFSPKYFSFTVLNLSLSWTSSLVFFTVSCCNKRILFLILIWKASFLAFRCSLQMSESEIMVHCRPGAGECGGNREPWSLHADQVAMLERAERPSVCQQWLHCSLPRHRGINMQGWWFENCQYFLIHALFGKSIGFLKNLITQNRIGFIANANFPDQNPLFLDSDIPEVGSV